MKSIKTKIDTPVLILMFVILFGIGELFFVVTKINENASQISAVELKIEGEYLRRERYDELLSQYKEIVNEDIELDLESILPTSDNFLDIIGELENIATLSDNQVVMSLGGVEITKNGFEKDEGSLESSKVGTVNIGGIDFDYVEIVATLRGNYEGLEQFLHLFKQSKYFMNIGSVQVNRLQFGSLATIDSSLTIQIYVQKSATEVIE